MLEERCICLTDYESLLSGFVRNNPVGQRLTQVDEITSDMEITVLTCVIANPQFNFTSLVTAVIRKYSSRIVLCSYMDRLFKWSDFVRDSISIFILSFLLRNR